MHKRILKDASDEQIREFVTDYITMIGARDPDLYKVAEDWLYRKVYGCHFNEWVLEEALRSMENEDGTKGGHWSIRDTNDVARKYDIKLGDKYNEYDWNYVMNMVYSDYYGAIPDELNYYVQIAKKFLDDKDMPCGKAYKYYRSMLG